MHQQSRAKDRDNVSGIDGAAIQDLAMQESMTPIYDRRQEHLGFSDRAVIFYRRLMLRLIKDNEDGKPLPAQDPALDFQSARRVIHDAVRPAVAGGPALAGRIRGLAPGRRAGLSGVTRQASVFAVTERNDSVFSGNAFKLGLFGSNCSGGLAFTTLPERWDASWDNNLQLAQAGGSERP